MFIKKSIKKWLHPLVWERLGQAKQEFFWTKKIWHCDSILVPILEEYLNKKFGYYVEVGANDGRSGSNTYHLEMSHGWSGVLVEPIMHLFFRSRQIRSLERNQFFNAACVSYDFKFPYVELFYSGMMTASHSDSRVGDPEKWAREGSRFLSRGEIVQKTYSQARTLTSILVEANAPQVIDFLSIDVEGAEFSVLMGIDFNRFNFNFILIETPEDSPSHQFLLSMGYECVIVIAQNILFKLKNNS